MAMYLQEEKNAINNYRFKFVADSDNGKTGHMAVIYTAGVNDRHASCPAHNCKLKCNGCYGDNFPCCLHWIETMKSKVNVFNLAAAIAAAKKIKPIMRHNVTGDLAITGSDDINQILLEKLTAIYKKFFQIAYSYTHCKITDRNIALVKKAMSENFVINFSTETVSDCKKCLAAGVNCVIAVNDMQQKTTTVDGVKIVKCPNSCDKNIKCVNCGLCYMKNRNFAIAFPVHGTKKEQVKKSGMLINL